MPSRQKTEGLLYFHRGDRLKLRHLANIGGVYVPPEYRGRGIGKALLLDAITHARTLSGLEDLILTGAVGNERARALYVAVGFTCVMVDLRSLTIGEEYFNIEWMQLSVYRTESEVEEALQDRCLT